MICNSPCELSAVSQFNLPIDFAVIIVIIPTLVYSSHVEYDKKYDISPKVNTAAPWSHRGPLEHNCEPDHLQIAMPITPNRNLFYLIIT